MRKANLQDPPQTYCFRDAGDWPSHLCVLAALQVIQNPSSIKGPDLIPCQRLMDTHESNLPQGVMRQYPRRHMALHMLRENWFWENIPTSPNIFFPVMSFSRILWEDMVSKSTFCFLCHGLALNSTSTKLYTMQIKREINKATPKQQSSLFEMLHQENNNRERRLNSKGMAELQPIKTTDVW